MELFEHLENVIIPNKNAHIAAKEQLDYILKDNGSFAFDEKRPQILLLVPFT